MIGIGLYMTSLPKGPDRGWWFGLHKSCGLTVLLLVTIRLSWRLHSPPPAFPGEWGELEATLAKWGHRGIYLLLLITPIAGFMTSAYTANPIKFWGLQIPRLVAENQSLNESWKLLHNGACYLLVVLVAGHAIAAIRHYRHGSRRMLSWSGNAADKLVRQDNSA
jgi:cytochrome b561